MLHATPLRFREIEYLRAMMINKTVSAAAKMLHVSQPNVSQLIKQIETRLSCRLFDRKKGRLMPTQEALAIFEEIGPLYDHLMVVNEAIGSIVNGNAGVFSIGCSPSLGRFVVPRLVSKLRSENPTLQIKIDVLSMSQVAGYLDYKEGQCAITIFPIEQPSITSAKYGAGRLVCMMKGDHRLAKKKQIRARDLESEAIVAFDKSSPHGEIAQEFLQTTTVDTSATTVRFAETACALVAQGLGIALIDEFTARGSIYPDISVVPTDMDPPFSVFLHHSANRASSGAMRRLTALLDDARNLR